MYKTSLLFLQLIWFSLTLFSQNNSYAFLEKYPVKSLPFTDSIRVNQPHSELTLTNEQKVSLSLDDLLHEESSAFQSVELAYRVNISNQFHSLVFTYTKGIDNRFSVLANYDLHYKLVESKQISFHESQKEKSYGDGWLRPDLLTVIIYDGNRTSYRRFLWGKDGTMPQRIYKRYDQLLNEGLVVDQRVVSARSGLIIRDSLGKRIGKLNFGDAPYIVGYTKDSIKVVDEGRTIWGRKAKIVLDFQTFMDDLVVPSGKNNIGYVFEGFLYKSGNLHSRYRNETVDKSAPNFYYYTNNVIITRENYHSGRIDIREFFEIEKVDLEKYRSKIKYSETFRNSKLYTSQENTFTLKFENGTTKTYKDTTYLNHEYDPTDHNELVSCPTLPEYYVIYHSFFEDHDFFILDKKTGKKGYGFGDYPLVSPNRKTIITVKPPFSYDDGTAVMEVSRMNGDKFSFVLQTEFIHWNIPNDRHIYWLSDQEFILRVKEVENTFSNEGNAQFFYLKFRLKA